MADFKYLMVVVARGKFVYHALWSSPSPDAVSLAGVDANATVIPSLLTMAIDKVWSQEEAS